MMFAKRLVTRGVCNRESFFPKGSCFSGGDIGSFHQLEGDSFWANPCIPLAKASSLHPSFSSSQRAWEVELVVQSKCWSIIYIYAQQQVCVCVCAGSNKCSLLGMTRGYVSKHGSFPRFLFSRFLSKWSNWLRLLWPFDWSKRNQVSLCRQCHGKCQSILTSG